MAEALISSDHFYVNASYYNDTESEQAATIVVEDNDDILRRDTGDEWLVHVTRFSCDSMSSLNYIEADPTATWQIAIQDGGGDARKVFNFTLDRAYATPRDMLSDMNMSGYQQRNDRVLQVRNRHRREVSVDAAAKAHVCTRVLAHSVQGFSLNEPAAGVRPNHTVPVLRSRPDKCVLPSA